MSAGLCLKPVHHSGAERSADRGLVHCWCPHWGSTMASTYPSRPDIHTKLIETAINRKTIAYSDRGTSRAWVGKDLLRLTHEEDAAGRPPLTAVVVHKSGGRPGEGFLQAMQEVEFARPSETEEDVWRRALTDVYPYWSPRLSDDRDTWPRFQ
jgi:hypothetical protein